MSWIRCLSAGWQRNEDSLIEHGVQLLHETHDLASARRNRLKESQEQIQSSVLMEKKAKGESGRKESVVWRRCFVSTICIRPLSTCPLRSSTACLFLSSSPLPPRLCTSGYYFLSLDCFGHLFFVSRYCRVLLAQFPMYTRKFNKKRKTVMNLFSPPSRIHISSNYSKRTWYADNFSSSYICAWGNCAALKRERSVSSDLQSSRSPYLSPCILSFEGRVSLFFPWKTSHWSGSLLFLWISMNRRLEVKNAVERSVNMKQNSFVLSMIAFLDWRDHMEMPVDWVLLGHTDNGGSFAFRDCSHLFSSLVCFLDL